MVFAACLQSVSQHKSPPTPTRGDGSRRRNAHRHYHHGHFEMDSAGSYPRHAFDLHRSDQDEATLAW
ncbi:hypothetical protein LPJ56_006864 [Coemansia sp. RSA 2599]|nr:hypothetical protein LPJ75_006929 [Coemansia sp. RSA 2598]KAJ1803856.1 hypothetical protein LPJ56_006864 [Coemansia sp. RSA 2599]